PRYGEEQKAFYVIQAPEDAQDAIERRLCAVALPTLAPLAAPAQFEVSAATPAEMLVFAAQAKHAARVDAARAVFLAAKALFAAETDGDDNDTLAHLRQALTVAYDGFTALYGAFHRRDNLKMLGSVVLEYPVLLSLEVNVVRSGGLTTADKAPIFTQRVAAPRRHAQPGSFTLDEAFLWCLAERVIVDVDYIATLAGITPEDVVDGLKGRIYRDLDAARVTYVVKDALCSGNVRQKLAKARRLAVLHPEFCDHIPALEAVLPLPLARNQIGIELGNGLVDTELVAQFIASLIPAFRAFGGTVAFHPQVNAWKLTTPKQARASHEARSLWGTDRRNFFDIFDAAIHQRELVVRDEIDLPGGGTTSRMNPQATLEANAVGNRIKEAFKTWLWGDESRATAMEDVYNAERNSHVERRFDGAHLTLAGLNTTGLRLGGDADPHQKDMIWRIMSSPVNYIAHPVGSGKTLMMVAGIAESVVRGLAHKSLVVVPNSLVGQWAADLIRFYPGLRVLAMHAKDFEKGRRQRFLALAATGAWDVVVVGLTTFTRIPLPQAIRRSFYQEEIAALRAYLFELHNSDLSDKSEKKEKKRDRALKKIESRVEKLEAKLKAVDAEIVREDERILNLVELGFDMLVIDEFHLLKNLEFSTTKTGIAGLPSGGSERAFDAWQKIQYFRRKNHKVVVASATPIANTIGEAYVNQKFLQWDLLQEVGLAHFDQWAAQFAKPVQSFELRPDANGFRVVTRLSTFINLPELHQLTRQVMDVRLEEQLNLPRPTIITGRPVPIVMPASDQLRAYITELGKRADAVKSGAVDPEDDNMLKISSDGRMAALDMRLVGGTRDEGNKLDLVVENLMARYAESAPWRGTQIVFCDLATPKGR
ncbi:MAG: SNF2-related protein, partial [Chloroflexales bacterium]